MNQTPKKQCLNNSNDIFRMSKLVFLFYYSLSIKIIMKLGFMVFIIILENTTPNLSRIQGFLSPHILSSKFNRTHLDFKQFSTRNKNTMIFNRVSLEKNKKKVSTFFKKRKLNERKEFPHNQPKIVRKFFSIERNQFKIHEKYLKL